jgi:alkylated DNA nucleotide flippase Atl1
MGAGGRIVFPKGTRHFREQSKLLRSEGVAVKDGRVAKNALVNLEEF